MRSEISAYLAYGVQIPNHFERDIEKSLQEIGHRYGRSVGYLRSGPRDNGDLFLTTDYAGAELGKPMRIGLTKFTEGDYESWNRLLSVTLRELGIDGTAKPSWFLIADND